ncbi:hypothetical protein H5410_056062 [Solanum commersonii]|uniref:Transposase-associated domain-containing protein n=1 Tax=Solanum commersonii TaxID=4109 RepID=A0A9J5WLL8_SOLCO|nr:hypothetical protein H5410_056062 [Solanum commersonii]
MDHRLWIYNMQYEPGAGLKLEFIDGVRDFIEQTMTLDIFKNNGLVRCPCSACGMEPEQYFDEAPNEEARHFYDQLEESSRPLCEGSPHSTLSVAMSSGGDDDKHREHLRVSQTNKAKKKKSRGPIDPEDIPGSLSSAPKHINHDTHLFAVSFGTEDPRQYYPNYRRPIGASSTSHALPPWLYEDLPLQAIH